MIAGRLGLRHPIIQAPMGGGPGTPALAAAVSDAGGLGFLAAGYLTPDELRAQIHEVRTRTRRPFGVNAFVPTPVRADANADAMLRVLRPWAESLGVELPEPRVPSQVLLREIAEVAAELAVPVFSVTFGVPDGDTVRLLHGSGIVVLGTATTVSEGRLLQEAGVDGVIAQGAEAGAHRASFGVPWERGLIGTMALVPQMVDAIDVPVIASGGIMDGRGIVAARALGAVAVQLGTAFLACDEAGTATAWRQRLLEAAEDETAVTTVFSGRAARGIRNRFMNEVEASAAPVPPFPLQNALTLPLRRAAAASGDPEALSLWAGQGLRLLRAMPAAQLMNVLVAEMQQARSRVAALDAAE